MKPELKLLFAFAAVLFFVLACNKDAQQTENKFASYKEWIHAHAGTYSNETITIKTKNGNIISGSLEWNKLTQLIFEGKKYVYIPFTFQIEGSNTIMFPYDCVNKISETSFSLVLRENDANTYDVALNTKLYAVEFSANALTYQGTLENYYTTNGNWINSWFYDKGNDPPQKIYRKTSSDNSIVHPSMAPVCDEVSITTYETECWQTGGPNNESECISVATTITYTYCDTPGGDGGGTGGGGTGGGGSYPPSGGGDGGSTTPPAQDPCAAAKPAAENATNISKSDGYSNGLNKVKIAASDNKEHGVSLNKNSSGVISSTAVSNGGEGSNDQPLTAATIASIHNHPNGLPPSAGDVYGLIAGNMAHKAFTTKYVTLPNGNMYALVITNPLWASRFKVKYPSGQVDSSAPDFPEALGEEFNNCYSYFNQTLGQSKEDANASALAFILDKYNAGVALLKHEDGSFNKLGTIQTGGSGDDATYGKINCPPVGGY